MASLEEKNVWERENVLSATYTAIIQVSAASLSFVASVAIASMIVLPQNGGLSTPYRRIIFGLSLSDIFQSIGLILGPWLVPASDVDAFLLGVGNKVTCQFNGFLIILGVQAVPMYLCLLCLYYLCRLKYKMADETFYGLIEKRAHALIVVFTLASGMIAVATDSINTALPGTICFVTSTPRGCDVATEIFGACEKGVGDITDVLKWIDVAIPLFCFGIILVLMFLLCTHAIKLASRAEQQSSTSSQSSNNRHRRRRLALRAEEQNSTSSQSSNDRPRIEGLASRAAQQVSSSQISNNRPRSEGFSRSFLKEDLQSPLQSRMSSINELDNLQEDPPLPPVFCPNDTNPSSGANEDRTKMGVIARIYKNDLVFQAGLYIGVFSFTYGFILVALVLIYISLIPPKLLASVSLFCFPLGGALNIIVYSRPKIASLRRRHPECPWWKGFVLVLQAGGEVPENPDLRCKRCYFSKPEREVRRCPIEAVGNGELGILTSLNNLDDRENISSAIGINGRSLSFGESHQGVYNPEENWVRMEGRADVTREAASEFSYELHVAQSGNERNVSSLSEPLFTDLGSTVISTNSGVEDAPDETSPKSSSIRTA